MSRSCAVAATIANGEYVVVDLDAGDVAESDSQGDVEAALEAYVS